MDTDHVQTCTKCGKTPEDILMLACNHDLCLQCAAERLVIEMKKRKPANSIVCYFCYKRTDLDAESIAELYKVTMNVNSKTGQTSRLTDKSKYTTGKSTQIQKPQYEYKPKYIIPERKYKPKDTSLSSNIRSNSYPSVVIPAPSAPARRACNEHIDYYILYFCFDCKCECICPECIIHGKHKDHNVHTIKKAYPVVRSYLESNMDKIDSNIEGLLIKKSEVEKIIRSLHDQSGTTKRQIQAAFDEARNKLAAKYKEMLARCDASLSDSLQVYEKTNRMISRRVEYLKGLTSMVVDYIKKDELSALNNYAKKWKEIAEELKEPAVIIPHLSSPSNENTLAPIFELTSQIYAIQLSANGFRY